MKSSIFIFFMIIALNPIIFAQDTTPTLTGEVSYITSKNVYVKFEHTDAIDIGDMLQLAGTNIPCLLVKHKSSNSCVCTVIRTCKVNKGEKVIYTIKPKTKEEPISPPKEQEVSSTDSDILDENIEPLYQEKIRGRLSVASYSNIASARDDRHRVMSRFSLNASHINGSKFSFETYLNYRQIIPTDTSKFSQPTRFFRVYNLAMRYDIQPTLSLVLGRRINSKISSLGAIDGLQVEKYVGKNYLGVIVGSRPDLGDYRFNSTLLEYGGYVGRSTAGKNVYSQTTLGIIEQRNTGSIDRRYAYFQHSSTLMRKLSLFSSMEMDIYRSVNGLSSNTLRLSNMFVSANYRFGRKASLMLSYDSRKRILYYETYQTEIEKLLDDDLARQGIRVRLNVRLIKNVLTGVSYSKRFQTDSQNKSDNLNAFFSVTRLPGIGGSLSVTYNQNNSNYLMSNILSARYSRSLLKNKLNAGFYYRMAGYTFKNSSSVRTQHYYGTNLSLHISKGLMFSASGELSRFHEETNYRFNTRLVKRFTGKKKK